MKRAKIDKIHRIRVRFFYSDEAYLYVEIPEKDDQIYQVRYGISGVNDEFSDQIPLFWRGANLNLLDVTIDEKGVFCPSFIVLEPDYLMDISSLAECYRDYGSHPGNYFMSRLMPIENARPLLLGNIANLFLDEWMYADGHLPDYRATMQKAFRQYPVELAACEDLRDAQKEKAFFDDCRMHFDHLSDTVQHTFDEAVYRLDKSDAVLEPSYICEPLGIQGRLDYMQRDMSCFIEMKSGKADEYSDKNKVLPKENNRVQMLLYMAVLEFSMNYPHEKQRPYLLYTRYPLLYPARTTWAQVRKVIALRNRIVASEYGVQMHNHESYTEELLAQINPQTLNVRKLRGRFWEQYLSPQIHDVQEKLSNLQGREKAYFYAIYNFITKELYLSKTGGVTDDKRIGMASLWLHTLEEKRLAGEILHDLRLKDNKATQLHAPTVTFVIPSYADECLHNFRKGDVVILYERNSPTDNVTNRMVFKGNIESISEQQVCVRLRASQRNAHLFPKDSLYAMEHDSMDTSFRSMYAGLWSFLNANQERRDLLLSRQKPRFETNELLKNAHFIDDFERITQKALSAKDYFLLVGPPGTGKTSRALNRMVRAFHADGQSNILLLAYTNRAVDEICHSLSSITPGVDYLRVGSELSCDERYRPHLLENALQACQNRKAVLERMEACRIYVGTVSTFSSKPELFKIKHFEVAIIDEATQILEPQLLGIWCGKSSDGRNAIDKFILIGDHKQLPAVVLQDSSDSEVHADILRQIGLLNLKDSLFERLYRYHLRETEPEVSDMLCKQGRMHPDVAKFANEAFYAGRLESVGLPHQLELINQPVTFLPSQSDAKYTSIKANQQEAEMAALYAWQVWKENKDCFEAHHTIGIITPYRNQIALIRKELEKYGVKELMDISVDTVERYQGSERDVIIYSFCVNTLSQLKTLPNLTEENGVIIDRKLNVALTRARKRLVIIGNPQLLREDPIYARLLDSIEK
ncbi:MAG: AAA family ATPase [Bacteroides sp.]|nr:AAA family ATPase [Bacteroides sp.]